MEYRPILDAGCCLVPGWSRSCYDRQHPRCGRIRFIYSRAITTKGVVPDMNTSNHRVLELRVALTTNDYERSVRFYSEGLGLEPAAIWNNDGGKALILDMG